MARTLALLVLAAVSLVSLTSSADVTVGPDGTSTLPVITIYGRVNRPSVTVILKTPTAARGAAVAHEDMKAAWLEKTEPSSLRSR